MFKHISPLSGQFAQSRELISNTNNRTEKEANVGASSRHRPSDCAVKRTSVDEELCLTHHGQATVTEGFTPPWHEETFLPLRSLAPGDSDFPSVTAPCVYRSGYRCIRRKKAPDPFETFIQTVALEECRLCAARYLKRMVDQTWFHTLSARELPREIQA